jgi:hypothetical protein
MFSSTVAELPEQAMAWARTVEGGGLAGGAACEPVPQATSPRIRNVPRAVADGILDVLMVRIYR